MLIKNVSFTSLGPTTAIAKTLAGVRAKIQTQNNAGRVIAVLEPRSNTMKSGVHSSTLPAAFDAADFVFLYQDEKLGWSVEEMALACQPPCIVENKIVTLIEKIVEEVKQGDIVVIMSNGGFSGIHDRLLAALQA